MIRVGLVGFGLGGRVFHAPLISSVEGLELAAVVERTSDHAAERYPGITTYRTLDELLGDASITLVVVTTPSGTHYEVASQALQAGKNVVVDKPVAVTSEEIARLLGWPPDADFNLCHFIIVAGTAISKQSRIYYMRNGWGVSSICTPASTVGALAPRDGLERRFGPGWRKPAGPGNPRGRPGPCALWQAGSSGG